MIVNYSKNNETELMTTIEHLFINNIINCFIITKVDFIIQLFQRSIIFFLN